MQVHYNLLAGDDPDVSATQLRLAPRTPTSPTSAPCCCPAPVELPCRPGHDASPLCDRDAAVADVKKRFGDGAGSTADLLYFLCGGKPRPGDVQSCTRTLREPMTIMGVAGHMHLLGRSIKIEVNPGTDRAQTVLDIPIWDFDNQGAKPVKPVHAATPGHRQGDLPSTCSAARPAARLRGPARAVRRVGRGHHRRDVPGHPAGHPALSAVAELTGS